MTKNTNNKSEKYIIVSDESVRKGSQYSYFYGGCIIKENLYEEISSNINILSKYLGFNEIKREKISKLNIQNYKKIIDLFFTFVRAGDIKVRIMYTPNSQLIQQRHCLDELYPKLYYLFFKKAFSLFYSKQNINLKLFMDELPESLNVNKKFKRKIISGFIKESKRRNTKVSIYKNNIVEVDSKKHIILQCIDIILGVIEFYLNSDEEHKISNRGKAKVELFNHIYNNYILNFCPNFNFDISTGYFSTKKAWLSPYKHFVLKRKNPQVN